MNDQRFLKLLKILMVPCALVFLSGVFALPAFYHRDQSTYWPAVTGVVTTSALKLDFHKPPHAPYYRPFVSYSYGVDGIPRGNTKITFNLDSVPRFPKEEGLSWLNQKYPVGKQIPVFYDPDDPDMAVLQPGAKDLVWLGYYLMGLGILMCVLVRVLQQRAKGRLLSSGASPGISHKGST